MKLLEIAAKKLSSREESDAASELCALLSRLEAQSLLATHDQIATRFEQIKIAQQEANKALMGERDDGDILDQVYGVELGDKEDINVRDMNTVVERFDLDQAQIDSADGAPLLSNEGRYLLAKAQHYAVENLKLVNIEKMDAPLGATIRNKDGSIVIGRVVIGGAADQSGLLHEDDEILEINSVPVRGKTINEVCEMLANLSGIVSFLIIPNMDYEPGRLVGEENGESEEKVVDEMLHIRAMFNYVPQEDIYLPCKELGLGFGKGDILHIICQEDPDWWQAYKEGEKDQSLAGLIPSQPFQERRFSQMRALIGDSFMDRKKRHKGFCIKNGIKNRRRMMFDGIAGKFFLYVFLLN